MNKQTTINELRAELERVKAERDGEREMKESQFQAAERARKACAEMREALSVIPVMRAVQARVMEYPLFNRFIEHTPLENDISAMAADVVAELLRAIPSDAGTGYFSREAVMPLVEALQCWITPNVPSCYSFPADASEYICQARARMEAALAHARTIGVLKEDA